MRRENGRGRVKVNSVNPLALHRGEAARGNFAEMENQKTVQKLSEFVRLGGSGFQF